MPNKDTTPLSLYGNDREYLREQEKTNEILADIAGEEYESPGDIPNGKYVIQKRLLDAAQKKNELLESIAEGGGGGGGGAAKAIGIDYATDVISLKNKDGETITGSGATLPAYGVSFDPTTGGLTLTKNGTAVSGQTVTIPNYGSPVGVTDSVDMVDEGTIYLYEGTTGGGFTNGHFYYYDGTAWADGGEYAAATVQTDKTLLVEDRAADAKATGEAVGELKTQLNFFDGGFKKFHVNANTVHSATQDKISVDIPQNGKFVISFKRSYENTIQFWCYDENNDQVMSKTSTEKTGYIMLVAQDDIKSVGMTVTSNTDADDYEFSVAYNNSEYTTYKNTDDIAETNATLNKEIAIINTINNTVGSWGMSFVGDGNTHSSNSDTIAVSIKKDEEFTVCVWDSVSTSNLGVHVYATYEDGTNEDIGAITQSNSNWKFTASNNIAKLGFALGTTYGRTYYFDVKNVNWVCSELKDDIQILARYVQYRNGSGGNPGNAKLVTATSIPLVSNAAKITVRNPRPLSSAGNYYLYDISAWKGSTWYTNRKSNVKANDNEELYFTNADILSVQTDVTGFGITVHEFNSAGEEQTLRYGDFINYPLVVRYVYDDRITTLRDIDNQESKHDLLNARHCTNPLTILHFSDLHADKNALKRITDDATYYYGANINEKICTGDIVANTYEEIASWWDKSVLTCIGNHETASYSGGEYNWTALSMANRDTYYIAPFEAKWNIEHTTGTSYYYKDYATQKVRMIVMDVMLYSGTPGAEATAQTAWLTDLLSDAITNNLHVLIAIHAPHGGATAIECSFSKYNQGAMPTNTVCDTPQTVIDAVDTSIGNGLHFIGYIVGHTHQDNMWDAEGNGKQLVYCITCAAQSSKAQWNNSDQDRSESVDAYNIITIDTANTLVKIIRGGGADIDDHMRTRKAICFNYATGEKVGEVL